MRILCNEQAEKALLCQMMSHVEVRDYVIGLLKEEDFYRSEHKKIFKLIKEQASDGKPTDSIALVTQIANERLEIDKIYLTQDVADVMYSPRDTDFYIEQVKEMAITRIMQNGANRILQAIQEKHPLSEINQIYEDIRNCQNRDAKEYSQSLNEIVNSEMLSIESDIENGITHDKYVKTGFRDIDRLMKFYPGQTYFLGARPAMGKTSLSLAFSLNMAKAGENVQIFTLETSKIQHTYKIISMTQNVTFDQIMEEDKHHKYKRIARLGDYLENNNLNDKIRIQAKSFSRESIIAEARRQFRKTPFSVVIIDLLNQIKQEKSTPNRNAEVEEIVRSLDIAAREFDAVCIVLSQLNRSVESRNPPEPRLSDLRDSGTIEQTAKGVLFLYRPEYYGIDEISISQVKHSSEGIAKVIIAKNNFGAVGSAYLSFDKNSTRFSDLDLNHSGYEPIDYYNETEKSENAS